MNFESYVYSGDIYLGILCAASMTTLKREASRMCNRYAKPVDKMVVTRANNQDLESPVTYYRINNKAPNNTILRGKWK